MDSFRTDTPSTSVDLCESEANARSQRALEGYETELTGSGPSLTYDLPNGQRWKKRIWPRFYCAKQLHRWNSAEEILSYLISFDRHKEWISTDTPNLPPSGSVFFFNKKETKTYRNDGHQWKTRRSNANCIREDRMKLKLHGYKLLYACYTHSLSNENFHRRSYWLLQNPDIIMVHYLEHCGSSQEMECVLLTEEERKALTPANLDFLTVSDRNLCSLLNMASSADDIMALMRQLSAILHRNILKFGTILEMVEANNAVLPFVKSNSIACKPSEQALPNGASGPSGVVPISRRPVASTVAMADVSTPSGLSLNPSILSQVLASNLLVFYQGEKSLSCFALNPAYNKPPPSPASPSPSSKCDIAAESSTPAKPQLDPVNHLDYDPDKFTQFANALIQMNPLDNLQSTDTCTDGRGVKADLAINRCSSAPLLCTSKDKVSSWGKSPGVDGVQTSQEPPACHVSLDQLPFHSFPCDQAASSVTQSCDQAASSVTQSCDHAASNVTQAHTVPWPFLNSTNSDILQFAPPPGPVVELPDCGTNLPLTSLWEPHPQDCDSLHSWLKGSDDSGQGSSGNHPTDVLNMELPLEVESLVSSSEFFQTSQLITQDDGTGHRSDDFMMSVDGSADLHTWEVDFSLQAAGRNPPCSMDSSITLDASREQSSVLTCPSQTTFCPSSCPNPEQACSESQSIFLFDQGSELGIEFGRDNATSPFPSSSSVESESSHSSVSVHDLFDTMDSPSVAELCEMLGESPNAQHCDFSHMTLTETEQHQLLSAARIIQNAFRKYRCRRQMMRAREKRAALVIECYYKRYREMKKMHAANRSI